jgi:hypothetical protein
VVAFGDQYLAVGTIIRSCCADGDPALNSGVTWTSADGRAWNVHDGIAAFAHASLRQVLVAGSRLLAIGTYAEPLAGGQGVEVPAMWTSSNGQAWHRVAGTTPTLVVVGRQGFLGADRRRGSNGSGPDSVTFWQSRDGVTWTLASDPMRGWVADLIATSDGGALAIGSRDGPPAPDGGPTFDAVAWHSADGVAWAKPTTIAIGATVSSVARGGPGYVAVGSAEQVGAAWSSVDGLTWRRETMGIREEETLNLIFPVEGGLLVEGDTTVDDTANVMIWFSSDGINWARVAEQDAFGGINNAIASLIATPSGILAVGYRWDTTTGHPIPQAWLASP